MHTLLNVSSSPHMRDKNTIQTIMLDVIIALIPVILTSIYYFGNDALILIGVSVSSCVFFEYIWQKIFGQKVTVLDLSAVITGILLAFNLPSQVPVYTVVVGAFVAIILVKQCFGGIGQNFLNPALTARIFLLLVYPVQMTDFSAEILTDISMDIVASATIENDAVTGATTTEIDLLSGATPLVLLDNNDIENLPSMIDAMTGNITGTLGETSALAILLGGLYLLYKQVITWHIPVFYIGTIFISATLYGGLTTGLYHIMLGGVMLAGVFMLTDYTTTPMTVKGQIIFAIGAGLLTFVFRVFSAYPAGVSYSILFMNLAVPLIDRFVYNRVFGGEKRGIKEALKLGMMMGIMALICAGVLSIVNFVTAPIIQGKISIEENSTLFELNFYAEEFVEVAFDDGEERQVFIGTSNGKYVGAVVKIVSQGYVGPIDMLVGIDNENLVTGIYFLSHTESARFGANMVNDDFKNQFINRKTPLIVTKTEAKDNEISIVAGSTITTNAVVSAVNEAVEFIKNNKNVEDVIKSFGGWQ
ncbi:MAG: hypothetical protein ATN36_06945 [Epulopiscium sp. Nele67-Bin005]|nr:MAG: hypothetical protein ATN36_06945 [Epulopiscium sp. Nele67-Bin005]